MLFSVPAVLIVKHDLKKVEAKDMNCTEDGNIEYWYCDTCGKYFSEEDAENSITLDEIVTKQLVMEVVSSIFSKINYRTGRNSLLGSGNLPLNYF